MSIKKMTKDELELLSNKDITNLILEESKKPINTADLFKKIIKLLDEHKSGKKDNSRKIWTIYSFLIWYKVYFINEV